MTIWTYKKNFQLFYQVGNKMDVLTRRLVVYFDEDTELTPERENAANILTISLTGTHEQIAGFLCLFFVRYGVRDNWDDSSDQDLILEFHDIHWHPDKYFDEIIGLNQRYVVVNSFLLDCHVELTTSDITQFVSGMNAVPTLEGQNMDGDPLTEYEVDWKGNLCYFDLSRDDQKDAYLNPENDPDISLSTLDTSGVGPLVTRFEVKRISEEDDNVPYLYFQNGSVGRLHIL